MKSLEADLAFVSIHGSQIQDVCHELAVKAGWWTNLKTDQLYSAQEAWAFVPEKLLLIHSEVSEACEAHRKDLDDDKLPHRHGLEVELADAVIRIFDLAGALKLDIGGAMADKLRYNVTRKDHTLEARKGDGGKRY